MKNYLYINRLRCFFLNLCLINDIVHLHLDLKGPEMVVLEIVNGKNKLIRSKNIHAAPQQLGKYSRLEQARNRGSAPEITIALQKLAFMERNNTICPP